MTNENLQPRILRHAVKLSERHGFNRVSRSMVAKSAEVAPGSVSYHFNSMRGLQKAVMDEAVATENLTVIAQGIMHKHKSALAAPEALRNKALKQLAAA